MKREWFYYRCKTCDRRWRSQRIEPRCPGCGQTNLQYIEVLDPPDLQKEQA